VFSIFKLNEILSMIQEIFIQRNKKFRAYQSYYSLSEKYIINIKKIKEEVKAIFKFDKYII